jgi:hypothetical protein
VPSAEIVKATGDPNRSADQLAKREKPSRHVGAHETVGLMIGLCIVRSY